MKRILELSLFISLFMFNTLVSGDHLKYENWQPINLNTEVSTHIQKQITDIVKQTDGIAGIGVYHLKTNQGFYWNGNHRFPMASTYKIPIAVRLLQLVEEGKLDLDQLVTIQQSDLVPGGEGVLSEQVFYPGVKLSLINLLQLMIRLSDNTATDKILSLVGGAESVTQAMHKLGIQNMNIDRSTLQLLGDGFGVRQQIDSLSESQHNIQKLYDIFEHANEKNKKERINAYETEQIDTTTPEAMVELLRLIATHKALQPKYADLLIEIMSQTKTGQSRLKSLLPESVIVAHKTGTFERTVNDVGYLISKKTNDDNVIIAVFINANEKGQANSEQAIGRIAQVAYQHFIQNKETDQPPLKKLLDDKITQLSENKLYQHAIWSVIAKDMSNHKIIYQKNANLLLSPASVNKLLSTAAAIHYLGSNYQFKTPVYVNGKMDNETLNGCLILVGSGDFIFGGRSIDQGSLEYPEYDHTYSNELTDITLPKGDSLSALNDLAKQIYKSGIRKINGNILIDDSLFQTITQRNVVRSPIMINENIIDIIITPSDNEELAKIEYRPQVTGFKINNEVITKSDGENSITFVSENNVVTIKGTINKNSGHIFRNIPITNPKQFAREAFIDALRKIGIEVTINPSVECPVFKTYKEQIPVAVYQSPPLSEYIKLILKVSHNTGADMLPLIIAAHLNQHTYDEGMKKIGLFLLNQVHLSPSSFAMIDASGSNGNYITPEAIIQLLDYMTALPKSEFQAFFEGMPILGVDGSIGHLGHDQPAKGKMYAKTGTELQENLANPDTATLTSKSLAGYISKNGKLIEFMVVVNYGSMNSLSQLALFTKDTVDLANILYQYDSSDAP